MDLRARSAQKETSNDRFSTALQLLFPLALLEGALWAPLPLAIISGASALWYMLRYLWLTNENAAALGLDVRGLRQSKHLLAMTLAIAAAVLAAAHYYGSLHRLWGVEHPWYAAGAYACWALVQEFMLQCFFLRLLRALVSPLHSLLLSGVLFAMAHLPNVSLTLLTFFGGMVFTVIYLRQRNLYTVAIIHAMLGLALAVSAPETWFHDLRVGRDFLEGASRVVTASAQPH